MSEDFWENVVLKYQVSSMEKETSVSFPTNSKSSSNLNIVIDDHSSLQVLTTGVVVFQTSIGNKKIIKSNYPIKEIVDGKFDIG